MGGSHLQNVLEFHAGIHWRERMAPTLTLIEDDQKRADSEVPTCLPSVLQDLNTSFVSSRA